MPKIPELPENCPICGSKMEKGYVVAPLSPIFWSKELTRKAIRSGAIVGENRFRIVWGVKDYTSAISRKCPSCKIVLFSYGEEKPEK